MCCCDFPVTFPCNSRAYSAIPVPTVKTWHGRHGSATAFYLCPHNIYTFVPNFFDLLPPRYTHLKYPWGFFRVHYIVILLVFPFSPYLYMIPVLMFLDQLSDRQCGWFDCLTRIHGCSVCSVLKWACARMRYLRSIELGVAVGQTANLIARVFLFFPSLRFKFIWR